MLTLHARGSTNPDSSVSTTHEPITKAFSDGREEESVEPGSQMASPTPSAAIWHYADIWHKTGFTGEGIKVGVIDGDFDHQHRAAQL